MIYDYKLTKGNGEELDLATLKGKVVMVVNTATGCGFTPQYDAIEKMYEEFKEQGFEVLDFPCNQFFHQAPGSDEEINQFCSAKFNTKFPRFKKIDVNGANADPLFVYLESQNEKGKVKKVKWNFTKFLIGRDGEFIARFEPTAKPESFENEIIKALEK